jgi:hypothetical protein
MQGAQRDIVKFYIAEDVSVNLSVNYALMMRFRLTKQFTYLEYLKDSTPTTEYWVSTGDPTQNHYCTAPLGSSQLSQGHATKKLQFLCTNSAPHTTKVDTDFSSSPRNTVLSKGVAYTG